MSTFRVRLSQGNTRTGSGNLDTYSRQTGSITGATNASPIVVTSTSHGLVSGQKVTITSVGGNTAANADWTITKVDTDSFSLNGSTGNGAYTSGGTWVTDSVQRTMYCMGPRKISRKLVDGTEFDDCNYWKRFTYPTLPYDQAFIEVVTDDGAPYVDGETSSFPVVYNFTIANGSSYTSNVADVLTDYSNPAKFAQITVTGEDVTMRINGSASAIITITAGTTQVFNNNDLLINKLEFANLTSGGTTATVEVLFSVESNCNS